MFTYVCICVFRHTQHTHLFGLFFDFFDFFDWATGTLDKAHESHELENPVSLEKEAQNHHWGPPLGSALKHTWDTWEMPLTKRWVKRHIRPLQQQVKKETQRAQSKCRSECRSECRASHTHITISPYHHHEPSQTCQGKSVCLHMWRVAVCVFDNFSTIFRQFFDSFVLSPPMCLICKGKDSSS